MVATSFEGGKTVPANGSIHVAFDRVLHPASVNRQAALVLEASGRPVGNPIVSYDPVARVLSLASPNEQGARWLTPKQPYLLVLTHPEEENSPGGVRAFDGATLERSQRLSFFAGDEIATGAERSLELRGFDPRVEFCRDVLPVFVNTCAGGTCHGASAVVSGAASRPATGLLLETPLGVLNTAVGRVARATNTGNLPAAAPPSRVFGVDMAVVEPGNPAASFMLYKLMLAAPREPGPPATAPVGATASEPQTMPTHLAAQPLGDDERERLRDAVHGMPMPYPGFAANLTVAELARLRAWIAQGARVDQCEAGSP